MNYFQRQEENKHHAWKTTSLLASDIWDTHRHWEKVLVIISARDASASENTEVTKSVYLLAHVADILDIMV